MAQPVLILNCGSSSIKYQVIDVETEEVVAKGLVQKVGDTTPGTIDHEVMASQEEFHQDLLLPDHKVALSEVFAMFREHGPSLDEMVAVSHRAVHGGDRFAEPMLITDEVVNTLVELSPLAPLHNPPGIAGIEAARELLPDVPHVAIFDTAFFANLPARSYTYAIDTEVAEKYHIRKYGFHGTSHMYVSQQASALLGREDLKQIVCHLGNGASISAVDSGQAVDTSMGLTPLPGLVMGTRSGDIDPGVIPYLSREAGMSIQEIDDFLNKRSGMLGLTGHTDMRDVDAAINAGDEAARIGMDVYVQRLVFYIGGFAAILGGLDAITFTAGVGENSAEVRKEVCDRLGSLGIKLNDEANAVRSKEPRVVSTDDSEVKVLVIPTNEELSMAQQTAALLASK